MDSVSEELGLELFSLLPSSSSLHFSSSSRSMSGFSWDAVLAPQTLPSWAGWLAALMLCPLLVQANAVAGNLLFHHSVHLSPSLLG